MPTTVTYEHDGLKHITVNEPELNEFLQDLEAANTLNIAIAQMPAGIESPERYTYDSDTCTVLLYPGESPTIETLNRLNRTLLRAIYEHINPVDPDGDEDDREAHTQFFAFVHAHKIFVTQQHLAFPELPPQIFSLIPYCAAAVGVALFKRIKGGAHAHL
jgi:hypothetical protein